MKSQSGLQAHLLGSHFLFLSQFIAHIGLLYLIINGEFRHWALTFFVYFLMGSLGMSMTFHRLLSHKSFRVRPGLRTIGIILGSIGLTGSALAWVAVHRDHHISPDRPGDPHSPNVLPWWKVQFFSMYHRPRLKLVRDLLRDKEVVFFHRNYALLQVVVLLALFVVQPLAVVYLYLAPAALLWHGGSLINTVGHKWGYRNYQIRDSSKNNLFLGYLMWGEGWHNNHHGRPNQKSFQKKPWELDLTAVIIRMIEIKKR